MHGTNFVGNGKYIFITYRHGWVERDCINGLIEVNIRGDQDFFTDINKLYWNSNNVNILYPTSIIHIYNLSDKHNALLNSYNDFFTMTHIYRGNFVNGALHGFVVTETKTLVSKTTIEAMYYCGIQYGRRKIITAIVVDKSCKNRSITIKYDDENEYMEFSNQKISIASSENIAMYEFNKQTYNEFVRHNDTTIISINFDFSNNSKVTNNQKVPNSCSLSIKKNGKVKINIKNNSCTYHVDGTISFISK